MKKAIITLTAVVVLLLIGLFASSSRAVVGPLPNPPDGDWGTWSAILESHKCFELCLARRLKAGGRDWSYAHFSRRVSISVIPEQKSISVRAYLSSQAESEEIAALALASLLEFIKEPIQRTTAQRASRVADR